MNKFLIIFLIFYCKICLAQYGKFSSDDDFGGSGLGGGILLLILLVALFNSLDADGRKTFLGVIVRLGGLFGYFLALSFIANRAQEILLPTKAGNGNGFVAILVIVVGTGFGIWLWNKIDR